MDKALPEYRQKLIHKIVQAETDDQIRRFIETTLRTFSARKINGHITERFLNKLSAELAQQISITQNPKLLTNIDVALIVLQKVLAEWTKAGNKQLLS